MPRVMVPAMELHHHQDVGQNARPIVPPHAVSNANPDVNQGAPLHVPDAVQAVPEDVLDALICVLPHVAAAMDARGVIPAVPDVDLDALWDVHRDAVVPVAMVAPVAVVLHVVAATVLVPDVPDVVHVAPIVPMAAQDVQVHALGTVIQHVPMDADQDVLELHQGHVQVVREVVLQDAKVPVNPHVLLAAQQHAYHHVPDSV